MIRPRYVHRRWDSSVAGSGSVTAGSVPLGSARAANRHFGLGPAAAPPIAVLTLAPPSACLHAAAVRAGRGVEGEKREGRETRGGIEKREMTSTKP